MGDRPAAPKDAGFADVIIGAVIVALGVAALLYAEAADRRRLRWLAKPLASAGFLLAALNAPAFRLPSGIGWWLFAGLVLSAIGDVLLVPKGGKSFLAGMAAFALAHVFYATWFVLTGVDLTVMAVSILGLLVIGHLVWTWLDPHLEGRLRAPVRLYILLVSLMAACAVAFSVAALGRAGLLAMLPGIGGVLFFLSDLFVARHRFVRPQLVNRALGLPLYYAGQLLLASALLTM